MFWVLKKLFHCDGSFEYPQYVLVEKYERFFYLGSYLEARPLGYKTRFGNTVGNLSDRRSRGREFDPGPVPYFLGD